MNPVHRSHPRRIPTSRAYWALKAEQVMNRVFTPEPSIDLEIIQSAPHCPPASPSPSTQGNHQPGHTWQLPLPVVVGGMGLALIAIGAVGWGAWFQQQQALQQERNLLLVERLRSLAPPPGAGQAHLPSAANQPGGMGPELPPPPPDEPWMRELATLPASAAPPARVLQVPVTNRIGAAAPPARAGAPAPTQGSRVPTSSGAASSNAAPLPQLVGVIQVPGRGGSAIFDLAGSSTSAAIGDSIGSSGWRLRSASGDSAVIERGGEQRRLSISGSAP